MARRKTTWKKGKVYDRRIKNPRTGRIRAERGRWEYPNGKKKGRRWKKVGRR